MYKKVLSGTAAILLSLTVFAGEVEASGGGASSGVVDKGYHQVKKGETLWGIASQYKLTVERLKKMNRLSGDVIRVGQVLNIQNGGTVKDKLIVSRAKEMIGVPYKWGGTTPKGFDCSGFMYYLISKEKKTGRQTAAGYYASMKKIDNPAAGDFVFFTTYKKGASHMGLYIGEGKFIHASSKGVKISSLGESYWKRSYIGSRSL